MVKDVSAYRFRVSRPLVYKTPSVNLLSPTAVPVLVWDVKPRASRGERMEANGQRRGFVNVEQNEPSTRLVARSAA